MYVCTYICVLSRPSQKLESLQSGFIIIPQYKYGCKIHLLTMAHIKEDITTRLRSTVA